MDLKLELIMIPVGDVDVVARELDVPGVTFDGRFHFVEGTRVDGAHPTREPFNTLLDFADPDGNTWIIQEVPAQN